MSGSPVTFMSDSPVTFVPGEVVVLRSGSPGLVFSGSYFNLDRSAWFAYVTYWCLNKAEVVTTMVPLCALIPEGGPPSGPKNGV